MPKLHTKTIPVTTDEGIDLNDAKDGFIVVGNIYVSQVDTKGQPCGGLVGRAYDVDDQGKVSEDDLNVTVLTKLQMLIALGYTQDNLREALEVFKRRGVGGAKRG